MRDMNNRKIHNSPYFDQMIKKYELLIIIYLFEHDYIMGKYLIISIKLHSNSVLI